MLGCSDRVNKHCVPKYCKGMNAVHLHARSDLDFVIPQILLVWVLSSLLTRVWLVKYDYMIFFASGFKVYDIGFKVLKAKKKK